MKALLLLCLLASAAYGQAFSSAYDRVRWNSVDITRRSRLNFTGTGVTSVVDDPALGQTTVTISGGGGGGADCGSAPTLLCLAGRAGTANNPLLSTDGDGTLTGSGAGDHGLVIQSSSAPVATAAAGFGVDLLTPPELAGSRFVLLRQNQDLTLNGSGLIGFGFGETGVGNPIYTLKSGIGGSAGITGMNLGFELRNASSETQNVALVNVVEDDSIITADGAAFTITNGMAVVGAYQTLRVQNGGTLHIPTLFGLDFQTQTAVGVTIDALSGLNFAPSLNGTTGDLIAVDVHPGLFGTVTGVLASLRSVNPTIPLLHTGFVRLGDDTNIGVLKIADGATHDTILQAQAQASTITYTLPAADGAGHLRSDGAGALDWDTTAYVPTSRTITAGTGLTGGGDLSANRTIALADTAVTPASYGDGTHVAAFTVDQQGRLTAASNVAITGAAPTGAAGGDLSGIYPNPTVAKINGVALGTTTATSAHLLVADGSAWQSVALSGDAAISAAGALTLASTITAGGPTGSATVAPIITWDAKGRLTAVTSATITPAASSITGGQALTETDDTNVTLALGGTPATALLKATSLTLGWTGTLAVARGGGGAGTALGSFNNLSPLTTRGDLLTRDATNNVRLGIGAAAKYLRSDGTDPSWQTIAYADISGTPTGLPPTGSASGDLSGSYPGPTVAKINGATLGTTTATSAHLLVADGSAWQSVALSGDATLANTGALTLASTITAGGPTGSATVAPIITWDAKGRLTAVSSATITPAASSITGGAALTEVDDTNVTLTLGGTPASALLKAASLTLGWTGQLAIGRGGTGAATALAAFNALSPLTTLGDVLYDDGTDNKRLAGNTTTTRKFLRQTGNGSISAAPAWDTILAADVPGSALTKADDTNVTLTLGGTPATALLAAASITAGWTGTLAVGRGGTGSGTALGGFNALSPLTTRGDLLTRDASNNVRLAIGAANTVLVTNGTDPSWATLVRANTGANTGTSDTFVFATAPTFVTSITDPLLYGGGTTSSTADIRASSAANYTGTVNLLGGMGDIGSNNFVGLTMFPSGLTVTPSSLVPQAVQALAWPLASVVTQAAAPNVAAGPNLTTFADLHAHTTSGTVATMVLDNPFFASPTIEAGTSTNITDGSYRGFWSGPITDVLSSGTLILSEVTDFYSNATFRTSTTVTTRRGLRFLDATGAGTLTNQIAVDVPALAKGGTLNVALRSAVAAGSTNYALKLDGTAQSLFGGKITTYNNVATAGYGVPAIVDRQGLTGKVADITDTAFTNAGTAGEYRVEVYCVDTTGAVGAGSVTANIKFNDGSAAQTVTVGPVALVTLGTFAQATVFVHLGSGSITYGTTHTGIFSTATYALYATAERLN